MAKNLDLSLDQKKVLTKILKNYLPNTTVWAYGSRVKGTAKPYSDLDLVAFVDAKDLSKVQEAREAFEESSLPFRVDLFGWDEIPELFKKEIEGCHIII